MHLLLVAHSGPAKTQECQHEPTPNILGLPSKFDSSLWWDPHATEIYPPDFTQLNFNSQKMKHGHKRTQSLKHGSQGFARSNSSGVLRLAWEGSRHSHAGGTLTSSSYNVLRRFQANKTSGQEGIPDEFILRARSSPSQCALVSEPVRARLRASASTRSPDAKQPQIFIGANLSFVFCQGPADLVGTEASYQPTVFSHATMLRRVASTPPGAAPKS